MVFRIGTFLSLWIAGRCGAIFARNAALGCVAIRSAIEQLDCFDSGCSDETQDEDPAIAVRSEAVRQNSISPASYRYLRGRVEYDSVTVIFDAQNLFQDQNMWLLFRGASEP